MGSGRIGGEWRNIQKKNRFEPNKQTANILKPLAIYTYITIINYYKIIYRFSANEFSLFIEDRETLYNRIAIYI